MIKKFFRTMDNMIHSSNIITSPSQEKENIFESSIDQPFNQDRRSEPDFSVTHQEEGTDIQSGEMSKDLLLMISSAIEKWQIKYHMEKIPKKIILQQAYSLLNDWEQICKRG